MSNNESTKDKPKSDGASSDICIVDIENANSSGETACWKRSSPANSSANRNRNSSPTFMNTPSPISSPSPHKPISRLKRIILAPNQPNSPKRFNKEITIAIGKLRPVNKFKFEEPTGNSPKTKFTASGTKFTACGTSTPRKSVQVCIPKFKSNSTQPLNKIEILENTIIKKAPNLSIQNQQTTQQILNELQGQRQSLQHQLIRIEEQLQHNEQQPESFTPPLPQITTSSHKNDAQHTPPSTPSPKSGNYNPVLTPPLKTTISPPPPLAQQQKEFEQQLKAHITNNISSNVAADPPSLQQPAFIPWAVQIEKQEQNLEKYPASSNTESPAVNKPAEPNPIPTQKNPFSHKNADQINSIPPKSLPNKASVKIPSVFIPQIASIERLTAIIDDDPHPITYTTTAGQDGGVRVKCKDTDSYNNLLQLLQKQNIFLHTHQRPEDKGLRIVIRNLHASTSTNTIRTLLANEGYAVKYANVLKNRYTGIPLNIFEVEIDCKNNPQAEQVLTIKRLGNQEVTIERQARRTDPVQCHRCQAFGHSKNYCRRAFVCLKCAGQHASTECKKDKGSPGLCANCGNQHVASYKGCPVYKAERSKLLAVKLSIPPATSNKNYHATTEQQQPVSPPQKTEIAQNEIHLHSKQFTNDNQINSINVKRPNWQPLQQRFNRRPVNMSPINSHKLANNNPAIAHQLANNVKNQKTYSQVAYEASANSPLKSSRKMHTPAPSKVPRPSQTPRKRPLHQLQQQIDNQNTQKAHPPQQAKPSIAQTYLERNQEFKDIKSAVAKNEISIIKLSEKVDMLLKLVNEHFKPIISMNTNKANETIDHEQQ